MLCIHPYVHPYIHPYRPKGDSLACPHPKSNLLCPDRSNLGLPTFVRLFRELLILKYPTNNHKHLRHQARDTLLSHLPPTSHLLFEACIPGEQNRDAITYDRYLCALGAVYQVDH